MAPDLERAFLRALENAPTGDVLGLLDHRDARVREAAATFLTRERPGSWLELVPRWLDRAEFARIAVAGLCRKTRPSAPSVDPDTLLLELARRGNDVPTRGEALVCIAAHHPDRARALALEWLAGDDRRLTRYAVATLGHTNAWYEVDRLIRLSTDADHDVRRAAVEALGHITNPPAAQALLRIAQTSTEDELREQAWRGWLQHPEHRTGAPSPSETKREVGPLVHTALRALRQRNLDGLARLTHPERGVRFGLCGQLIPSAIYPVQVRGLLRDQAPKSWGGSCRQAERELTFDDYLDHLLGFEDAPIVGYDVWLASTEKARAHLPIAEVERAFPDGTFVELAWPEGRDGQTPWESLVLVFAPFGGEHKLVGVLAARATEASPVSNGPVPPPDIQPEW